MLRPRMVMEALCSEKRTRMRCARTMFDLHTSGKLQSWSFSKVTNKVVAIAEVDPREVMYQARKSCRLIRVDWVEDPRLKKIKDDPSKKWWVDPIEDLRTKWYEDIANKHWLDPAGDPRRRWLRKMTMEMLSCDPDEWAKALRLKRRFEDKIHHTSLDRDLKKLFLIGDMDPSEVVCCLRDYCRLITVEWIQEPRKYWLPIDGNEKILIPNLDEVDEEEAIKRKILDEMIDPADDLKWPDPPVPSLNSDTEEETDPVPSLNSDTEEETDPIN